MRRIFFITMYGIGIGAQLCFVGYAAVDNRQVWAVIREPVVDLVIHQQIPRRHAVAPDMNGGLSAVCCSRAHQALMNEVVRVVAHDGDEVQVVCDNVVYGFDRVTGEPLNTFWVKKQKLFLLSDLDQEALATLPGPFDALRGNVVVLRLPWNGYSVGTRFMRYPQGDTADVYGIRYCDAHYGCVRMTTLPRYMVHKEEVLSSRVMRKLFVQYAYDLIEHASRTVSDGVIPYVWGGSSYVHPYKDGAFIVKSGHIERSGVAHPYRGYDCSELILRLAQIVGIPYRCKLTSLMSSMLTEVPRSKPLQEGDLIWMPGHVMMVSNLKRNELIEARGYGSGHGRVQALALKDYFQNITTYEQLRRAAYDRQPLLLLKKDGSVQTEVKELRFYKLLKE